MNNIDKFSKVSIITASYNNIDTIKDTILSVLNQTHSSVEYIIMDGGSDDGTIDFIRDFEDEFRSKLQGYIFKSEKDEGIADAWNKGLKLATGDVIFFLNSDDWIQENTLEKALKSINPDELEISYGICNRVDKEKTLIGSFQNNFNKYRILFNFGFSFTTCFVTKRVYDEIGGFNTSYKIAIDSDFLLRCVKKGVKFKKGTHETYMRIGGVSTKYRLAAHKEYKKALLANGYPKLLVKLSYFFFKRT